MPPRGRKPKASSVEAKQYVCIVPCWHNGHKWRKGRVATFRDDYPKDAKGNLVHFEELSPGWTEEDLPVEERALPVQVNAGQDDVS